jgi:hypothetical protein
LDRKNTRVYYGKDEESGVIHIRYHQTEILHYHPDGVIEIDLDGWTSKTTLERLNEFSPFSFYLWRRKRTDEEKHLIVDLDGGWYWWSKPEKKRRRTYIITDPYKLICVLPDKRRAPYEVIGEVKLQTRDVWDKFWTREEEAEKRRQQRIAKRLAKYRRRVRQVARFMPRDVSQDTSFELIRKLFPEYVAAEARLQARATALDGRQRGIERERVELQAKINELTCANTKLENDVANAERERDEYMYQVDAMLHELEAVPPDERQRSIVLEQP